MKKSYSKVFLFVGITAFVGVSLLLLGNFYRPKKTQGPCAFCNPAVLERQKFYETDRILGLVTHKPIVPGHVLIVSKRHVERFEDLTAEEIAEIGATIKKVNAAARQAFGASGYLLLEKNGIQAGQTVPHMHVHYIPRKEEDSPSFGFLLRFFFKPLMPAVKEAKMREEIMKMQISLSDTATFSP